MKVQTQSSPRLVLASANGGKVRELRQVIFERLPQDCRLDVERQIVTMSALGLASVPETGTSFAQNALRKARAVWRQTGVLSVADDSGLEASVLGGAPGIFSARWAGRHGDDAANMRLLLDQLSDIAPEHRQARYVCAIALVGDGIEVLEHGYMPGVLLTEPQGDGGFGYDPVMRPEGSELSCAQMDPAHKNAISHRRQALDRVLTRMLEALGVDESA